MYAKDFFKGRTAVIANKHKKERVIAPLLEEHLGLKIIVPEKIDTDQFGTFTRDVPRNGTQRETARAKALEGIRLTGASIGIASEGAFGPYPAFPFVPANIELVVLIDTKHDLEIVGESISPETNFDHAYISSLEEAKAFAKRIGFPSHGLVIRAHPDSSVGMVKGVSTMELLENEVEKYLKLPSQKTAFLETDMRAHFNPTRMENIRLATEDFVKNSLQSCLKCGAPGFRITEKKPGLPCELCGSKTDNILADVYTCHKCGFTKEELYPDGIRAAYAGNCGYCNP
jgi:hypothetical protein